MSGVVGGPLSAGQIAAVMASATQISAGAPTSVAGSNTFVYFAAFDGTNNSEDPSVANVYQTTSVLQLSLQARLAGDPNQRSAYFPGVGTPGRPADSSFNPTTAAIEIAREAYNDFAAKAYDWMLDHPDGTVTSMITSFSRGGASAAIFSQMLYEEGLVYNGKVLIPAGADSAVAAALLLDPVVTGVDANCALAPSVKNVTVVRANDEHRHLFEGVDYHNDAVKYAGVAGNHGDIGGFYDRGLGAIYLEQYTKYFQAAGLHISEPSPQRQFVSETATPVYIHSESIGSAAPWNTWVDGGARQYNQNQALAPDHGKFTAYNKHIVLSQDAEVTAEDTTIVMLGPIAADITGRGLTVKASSNSTVNFHGTNVTAAADQPNGTILSSGSPSTLLLSRGTTATVTGGMVSVMLDVGNTVNLPDHPGAYGTKISNFPPRWLVPESFNSFKYVETVNSDGSFAGAVMTSEYGDWGVNHWIPIRSTWVVDSNFAVSATDYDWLYDPITGPYKGTYQSTTVLDATPHVDSYGNVDTYYDALGSAYKTVIHNPLGDTTYLRGENGLWTQEGLVVTIPADSHVIGVGNADGSSGSVSANVVGTTIETRYINCDGYQDFTVVSDFSGHELSERWKDGTSSGTRTFNGSSTTTVVTQKGVVTTTVEESGHIVSRTIDSGIIVSETYTYPIDGTVVIESRDPFGNVEILSKDDKGAPTERSWNYVDGRTGHAVITRTVSMDGTFVLHEVRDDGTVSDIQYTADGVPVQGHWTDTAGNSGVETYNGPRSFDATITYQNGDTGVQQVIGAMLSEDRYSAAGTLVQTSIFEGDGAIFRTIYHDGGGSDTEIHHRNGTIEVYSDSADRSEVGTIKTADGKLIEAYSSAADGSGSDEHYGPDGTLSSRTIYLSTGGQIATDFNSDGSTDVRTTQPDHSYNTLHTGPDQSYQLNVFSGSGELISTELGKGTDVLSQKVYWSDGDYQLTTYGLDDAKTIEVHKSDVSRFEIYGGSHNDTMSATNDTIALHGGDGDDSLSGSSGDESLYGDAGDDLLLGSNGYDILSGGEGNNVFRFVSSLHGISRILNDPGADVIELGEGINQSSVSLKTFDGVLFIQFDQFTIEVDQWLTTEEGVGEIKFGDGTVWDRTYLASHAVAATSAPVPIVGSPVF